MSKETSHWSLDSSAIGSTGDSRQSVARSINSASTGVISTCQEVSYFPAAARGRQVEVKRVITGISPVISGPSIEEHRPSSRALEEESINKKIAEIGEELVSLEAQIQAGYKKIEKCQAEKSMGEQISSKAKDQLRQSASSSQRRRTDKSSVNVDFEESMRKLDRTIKREQEAIEEKTTQKTELGQKRLDLIAKLRNPSS